MMMFKNMLKLFSKTEVQEEKNHPTYLSQTILNRLFGRVLEREGVNVSCAEHTEKDLSSNRLTILTTLKHKLDCFAYARNDDLCAEHTEKHLFSYSPIHLFTFKKVAFTLAEVLITLGIIGVVAALTLPTLIQNHQKQTYVTGLKKAYANLQNAFAKMAYDEGVTDWNQLYCFEGSFDNSSGYSYPNGLTEECFNRLKKQFNVVKSEYFGMGNFAFVFDTDAVGYFYTNDGMAYIIGCSGANFITVDINGDMGPNKWGRDRFSFSIRPPINQNKVLPVGAEESFSYQTYCTTAKANLGDSDAKTCTAKVLIEGKMDY